MRREASARSSMRSHGSSTSSTGTDPRQKLQDCCRKLVAFMCTQVGVGGLIVGYAIIGAFTFVYVEEDRVIPEAVGVNASRNITAMKLWELTTAENTFNESAWIARADFLVKEFQKNVSESVKKGYITAANDKWSFSAALMFSLSIFTMLGYGNLVPRTNFGRLVTIVYAVFGIPLYALYLMNMGKVLAQVFRWVYTKVYLYSMEDKRRRFEGDLGGQPAPRIIVPPTACLWVMGAYIAVGSFMFSKSENWSYLDSTYFCVTSLCKIGFGDFVPGADIKKLNSDNQNQLIINFVYILLGMGLMAMCYNLMKELVHVKMREFKNSISICFEVIRLRAIEFYRRGGSLDYD